MSFLTTFEEWVDKSFARIFPSGKHFSLQDVARGLSRIIENPATGGARTTFHVSMHPDDLKRLSVSSQEAAMTLRSLVVKRAQIFGRSLGGGLEIEAVARADMKKGSWEIVQSPNKPKRDFHTVFIDDLSRSKEVGALICEGKRYLLLGEGGELYANGVDADDICICSNNMSLGRYGGTAGPFDIEFDEQSVTGSKVHATITVADDSIKILDNQSTNGVTVNGDKVHDQTLLEGDEICLGRVQLRFEMVSVSL